MVVIVITGVPGTGKSTLAKELSKYINAKVINIGEYAKKKRYVLEYDEAFQTYIVDEEKTIKDLVRYIKENPGNYIIEGTFSHLLPKEIVDLYIVLKADPNLLYKRLSQRKYPYHKIFENIWAQNLEIIEDELESENKKYIVIDTTNRSLKEIVEEIMKILKFK